MAILEPQPAFLISIENKCGELSFSTKTEELTLHCFFCGAKLKKLAAFIKHLKLQHLEELQKELSSYDADDEDNKSLINSKKRLRSSRKNIEPLQVKPDMVQVEKQGDPLSGTTQALEVLNDSDDDEKLISFESLKFCKTEVTQIADAKVEVLHEEQCELIQSLADFANVKSEADDNESWLSMPEVETTFDELNDERCASSQSIRNTANSSCASNNGDDSQDEDYIPKTVLQKRSSLPSCKMKKGKEITFELITELEKHPNVWNSTHEDHQLISARKRSYASITEALKIKFPDEFIHDTYVKYKIRELFSIFKKTEKGKPPAGSAKYYERLQYLKGHLKDKLNLKPNAQGLYVCSICSKECRYRATLNEHLRRHQKKYTHKCEICPSAFYGSTELRKHMLLHTMEKPYICEMCGMSFRRQDLLRKHTLRHLNQRNYKCTMCPNAYYSKGRLQDHMNTHTQTKDEKCDVCGKMFHSRPNLKQHMKLHDAVKAYPCQICNKPFATSSGRSKHKLIHSKMLQA